MRACSREHDWTVPIANCPELPDSIADTLVERACLHGVEACAYLSLRGASAVGKRTQAALENAYFAALQAHARSHHDLGTVTEALDARGLAWLTFKGPVLAESVYSRADLRSYGDLDVLVAPDRLGSAVTALGDIGGVLLERNWQLARRRMHGEVHVRMPAGTMVDLHWHVCNEPSLRAVYPVPTMDLLMRSERVELDGRAIPTYAAADMLVHLALHACMSGGTRLLWSKDLEQAAQCKRDALGLDWDQVVARARWWHAGPATAVMLLLASRTLDFELPPGVIRALSPGRTWRTGARALSRPCRQ